MSASLTLFDIFLLVAQKNRLQFLRIGIFTVLKWDASRLRLTAAVPNSLDVVLNNTNIISKYNHKWNNQSRTQIPLHAIRISSPTNPSSSDEEEVNPKHLQIHLNTGKRWTVVNNAKIKFSTKVNAKRWWERKILQVAFSSFVLQQCL